MVSEEQCRATQKILWGMCYDQKLASHQELVQSAFHNESFAQDAAGARPLL
jgi:hypothetical protein